MTSLTTCLKKAGTAIHADDKAQILARSAELRRNGESPIEAARKAVGEQLAKVRSMLAGEGAAQPSASDRIEDAGEKIGGARKDTASKTGARHTSAPADDTPGWRKRYVAIQSMMDMTKENRPWILVDKRTEKPIRGEYGRPKEFASEAEAEAMIPLVEVARNHRVTTTGRGDDTGYIIVREVTDRKRVQVVPDTFATRDDAMRYMLEHATEIIETRTSFGEEILPRPENAMRTGESRRTGDAKGEDFIRDFGLRGVEFGNWNNQTERQEVMNHAYDALADLAALLNIPSKALGLDGELGLAFGARGQGLSGARAHYEPGYAAINLTKMSGAGSLAHEWFHALDHYFGRQDGKTPGTRVPNKRGDMVFEAKGAEGDMASHGFKYTGSGVRPELQDAYKTLMNTMFKKAQTYVEDTQKTEKFVGTTKTDLAQQLQQLRGHLSEKLPDYFKRNNKPASAENLAAFDAIAERLIAGDGLATEWRMGEAKGDVSRGRMSVTGARWTNDALEQLSAIIKSVRGRTGFTADRSGTLDSLRNYMTRYEQRLKMLADAQAGSEKVRQVPTEFAMEARSIDQGRASDYWTTPHEMAARAFEAYVNDKVAEQGNASEFLTYGTNGVVPTPWGWARPYPRGAEREAINKAFDAFVKELKTRETDKGVALFSRSPQAARKAMAWNEVGRNAEGPEFYGRDVSLIALQQLNTSDEFAADALPMGHASHVREGNTASRFLIVDKNGDVLGEAALEIGKDGQIEAIHDIEIADKRTGVGRQVVAGILANASGPVRIIDILDQSEGFWQRMGAGYKDHYGNATADWASFQRADSRGVQGEGPGTRQGMEADARTTRQDEGRGRSADAQRAGQGRVDPKADRGNLAALLEGSSGVGLPVRLAERYAKAYADAGLHNVHVARNINELPEHLRRKLSGIGDDVRGAYFPREDAIWVFSDKLGSPDELAFVVLHEAFHRGLGHIFGDNAKRLLRQMYATNKKLRDRADSVARELKITKDEAIEEALADLAGEGGATQLRGWAKLAGMIRDWLNKLSERVGLGMRFTDAQIETFVAAVARAGINQDPTEQARRDGFDPDGVHIFPEHLPDQPAQASRAASMMAGINQQGIRDKVSDLFSSAGEKVSWWQKTVGTQYAKAQQHPEFKKVFDAVQGYIEDTSSLANEAADFAPSILPKLESLSDITDRSKYGLNGTDAAAVAAPIFEGTLNYGRQSGKLVAIDTLQREAEAMTTREKEARLFADGLVSEAELKRWKATPLDIYEGAIRNRYEREYLAPGVVFTRPELREKFGLTEAQIDQYEQFRSAVNGSLDQVVAADTLRLLGDVPPELKRMAMENRAGLHAAVEKILQAQADAEPDPAKRDQITQTWNDIADKYAKVDRLKARGYAPLMRFGKYLVSIKGKDGEQQFFGLYETRAQANRMARELDADPEFKGRVEQGVMSQEAYKLFSGVPVESLEMFADAVGAEKSAVFQEYLRLTKNNRSALKRLINRKGTAGFSDDVTRVLASFVTSNARLASGALNMGNAKSAAEEIRAGDLKDEAVKLVDSVQNPQETAGAIRGLMFMNFIGGSIASALVNTTQPVMMTLPYLSQWGGGIKAAGRLLASARMAAGGKIADKEMAAALHRGEQDGIVSPQEIHHLTAEAMGTFGKNPFVKRAMFLWGAPFSVAEQFNRRVTFIAAYQTAKAEGMADPFAFAKQAIIETQGLYNKGNQPDWARNAIGATALTFKQFSIHYLEWLGRMWNAGEPGSKERAAGRRAVLMAAALLLAAGGSEGLPFAEDLNDLIDTFLQSLGYDTSAKGWKRDFIANTLGLGDTGADIAQRGLSALPGMPLDVSVRMGMGNLLPGTGMLLKSNTDVSKDVLEFAGAFGGLVNQYKDAGKKALNGDVVDAGLSMLPNALQNIAKAAQMWQSDEYRDTKGRKVMDVDEADALMKLLGFQPANVARESATINREMRRVQLARAVETQIADLWAQGQRERDPEMVAEARQQMQEWNDTNPRSRIAISSAQIRKRVHDMQSSRVDRFERSAPKELRSSIAEALQ